MGGGSSSSSIRYAFTRYAPYLEARHSSFLDAAYNARVGALLTNPYDGYVELDFDTSYIGIGVAIEDFGSLFTAFGKYLSGFDIEQLWARVFWALFNEEESENAVKANIAIFDDEDIQAAITECKIAARKIGAVVSSSFVVVQANIEKERLKKVADLYSEAQINLLEIGEAGFAVNLNNRNDTVKEYALIMKDYFTSAILALEAKYGFAAKKALWPFTVMEYERAALGALRRNLSLAKTSTKRTRSALSKGLLIASNVVTGAMAGLYAYGYVGAIVGAVVGLVVGIAQILLE
jgi:hypothetical protein